MAGEPLSLTFSCSTDAHATGDVVAAPEELVDFSRENGRGVLLQSLTLVDASDTGIAFDLVFLNANGSIGAESAAFAPTDAVAATVIGVASVAASDYADAANSKIATVKNIGLLMHPVATSTSVYVGLVARGSITPGSASDITVHFGRLYA